MITTRASADDRHNLVCFIAAIFMAAFLILNASFGTVDSENRLAHY